MKKFIWIFVPCIALLAFAGYDVLNGSQWTRIIGTNGFKTTLTALNPQPAYELQSTLVPPSAPGLELVGFCLAKFNTGGNNDQINYGGGNTVNIVGLASTWTMIDIGGDGKTCYYDSNYISSLATTTFLMPNTPQTGWVTCQGLKIIPKPGLDYKKFIVVISMYTRWGSYYGDITDASMDEVIPVLKDNLDGTLSFTLGTENGTASIYGLSGIFIFYENL